jgi:hypothetical protein
MEALLLQSAPLLLESLGGLQVSNPEVDKAMQARSDLEDAVRLVRNMRAFSLESLQYRGGATQKPAVKHWTSSELLHFFEAALLTKSSESVVEVLNLLMRTSALDANAQHGRISSNHCPAGSTIRRLFF